MLEAPSTPRVVLPSRYVLGPSSERGPFGVLFEARDLELGRDVTLKVLARADASELRRVEEDERRAASLSHPTLLPLLDAGFAEGGEPYLVMERLSGVTIAERLARGQGLLTSLEATRVLEELLDVLSAMEARQVVHGELRASTVLLEPPGRPCAVRLLDAGLAKLLAVGGPIDARVSPLGARAPESHRGAPPTSDTDLHAVGATLFEALTGRLPFVADSPTLLVAQVLQTPAPSVASLRADVDPILAERIDALLEREPTARRRGRIARAPIAAQVGAPPQGSTVHISVVAPDPRPPAAASPSPDPDLPAELRAVISARYELGRRIGAGGMGVVYEARERTLDRPVALKVLRSMGSVSADQIERFEREARTAARLGHPNIVAVSDFGQVPGVGAYFAMELLAGESLAQRLARKGALPTTEVKDVALQVLDALAVAHRAGVVHRDLKPENIHLVPLATGARLAKLLDFGIVKLRESPTAKRLTERGMMIGTPRYMAPEQVQLGDVDARTDVYAMGATMYHALVGAPPYDCDGVAATIAAIERGPPPPLTLKMPELDRRFAAIVERAMARAPADRFADAGQMRDALVELDPRAVTVMAAMPASADAETRAMPRPANERPAPPRARPAPARSDPPPARAVGPGTSVVVPMQGPRGIVVAIALVALVGVALAAWGLYRRGQLEEAPTAQAPPSSSEPALAPALAIPAPAATPVEVRGVEPPAPPAPPAPPERAAAPRVHPRREPPTPPATQAPEPPPPTSEPAASPPRLRLRDGLIDPFATD